MPGNELDIGEDNKMTIERLNRFRTVDKFGKRDVSDETIADFYSRKNPLFGERYQSELESRRIYRDKTGKRLPTATALLNYEVFGNSFGTTPELEFAGGPRTPEFQSFGEGAEPKETGIAADIRKRGIRLRAATERMGAGKQTELETAVQLGSEVAGGALNVVGEGIAAIAKTGFNLLPEFAQEGISKRAKNVSEAFVQSKIGQQLIRNVIPIMENFEELERTNPRVADNLRAVVNIVDFVTSFGIGKGVKKGVSTIAKGAEETLPPSAKAVGAVAERALKPVEESLSELKLKDALEMTKPILRKEEKVAAIEAGRLQEGFTVSTIAPDQKSIDVAKSVQDIITPGKTAESIDNIRENVKIESKRIDQKLDLASKNKTPEMSDFKKTFKQENLDSYFVKAKEESTLLFKGLRQQEKMYDAVVDEFKKILRQKEVKLGDVVISKKSGELDLLNVQETLRAFDKIINTKLPNVFDKLAGNNLQQNAILDVREAANRFIADNLPLGNTFRKDKKIISDMLTARRRIARNAEKNVDINLLERVRTAVRKSPVVIAVTGGIITFSTFRAVMTNPIILGILVAGGSYKIGKAVITSKGLRSYIIKYLKIAKKLGNTIGERKTIQEFLDSIPEVPTIPISPLRISQEENEEF